MKPDRSSTVNESSPELPLSRQTSPRPEATIITVCTNEKHRLIQYMPAVWAANGNFELIISDNGSTDGSVEFVRQNYPETRIVLNEGDLGFAAGNNRASKQARAEILVLLNPDTKVEPDWLIELLRPLKDPTVGLATSKILLMSDPDKLNACGCDVHLSGLSLCRGTHQPADRYPEPEDVAAIQGASFAIRREVYEAIGGFNENYFMYVEETALSLEARLQGWRCVYAPNSVVQHDYALRFGPEKVLYLERNRYMMLLQVYKWPTLILLLPTLLLTEVMSWGFVLLRDRKHWTNKFKAYAAIFQNWPDIRAKRSLNQSRRKVKDRDLLKLTTHKLDFRQVSRGAAGKLGALVFNPLYWVLRTITLFLVRW